MTYPRLCSCLITFAIAGIGRLRVAFVCVTEEVDKASFASLLRRDLSTLQDVQCFFIISSLFTQRRPSRSVCLCQRRCWQWLFCLITETIDIQDVQSFLIISCLIIYSEWEVPHVAFAVLPGECQCFFWITIPSLFNYSSNSLQGSIFFSKRISTCVTEIDKLTS